MNFLCTFERLFRVLSVSEIVQSGKYDCLREQRVTIQFQPAGFGSDVSDSSVGVCEHVDIGRDFMYTATLGAHHEFASDWVYERLAVVRDFH